MIRFLLMAFAILVVSCTPKQEEKLIALSFDDGPNETTTAEMLDLLQEYDILINTLKDGDIVLLHDFQGNDNTVEALKMLIPEMKKHGYTFVTVTELYKRKGVTPAPHNGVIYSNVLQ